VSYQFRPQAEAGAKGVVILGNTVLGVIAALGFVFGAVCSAMSGYVSMWVAALNIMFRVIVLFKTVMLRAVFLRHFFLLIDLYGL
jgi:Na+/H+-translocating membrane pyrophosphatase